MGKSIVGDPIQWPGLVYSPINTAGLLFVLGTVANDLGLLLEEFSGNCKTAICRRKTELGWERLTAALVVHSSEYDDEPDAVDILICWIDDAPVAGLSTLTVSQIVNPESGRIIAAKPQPRRLESILPQDAAQDLLERGRSRENYEETIRRLDEQIKKLQNE